MEAESAAEAPDLARRGRDEARRSRDPSIRCFEVRLDHVGPLLRQTTGRNRRVELLPGRGDHCLNETVDGFPSFLRDVCERVSVAEPFVQLLLRQPEIGRRCLESPEPTRVSVLSVTARAVKAPEATE